MAELGEDPCARTHVDTPIKVWSSRRKQGSRRFCTICVLAGAQVCFLLPAPVWAQDSNKNASGAAIASKEGGVTDDQRAPDQPSVPPSDGLEDIVVTAQRRSENLQTVPLSVSVVTSEKLTALGIKDVTDLNILVPSLNMTLSGGAQLLPRLRGVGTQAFGPGIENPIATYIDGVYISSQTSALTALTNIAQVAVLKGPQGTLFGRNATGGLIQITTKDPSFDPGGIASLSYGNLSTYGGNLYVTGGLDDVVAADLALYYNRQADGFGHNLATGHEVNKQSDFTARSKIFVNLGPNTTLKLGLDYSQTNSRNPAYQFVKGTTPFTGVAPVGGFYDINSNVDPRFTTKQGGASLTGEHQFSTVTLLSITAYRRDTYRIVADNDKSPLQIVSTDIVQNDSQFSQELQLASRGSGPLTWTAGVYYFWSAGSYAPLIANTTNGTQLVRNVKQTTNSLALYGQATYALSGALNLTAGLRYTSEKRGFDGRLSTVLAGATIPGATQNLSLRTNKPSWRVALDYKVSDQAFAYASYSRGFKSAGFNLTVPTVSFAPETLDSYEAGIKTDLWNRSVRFNLSTFYYDYKNIQATQILNGVASVRTATSATIYGVDVDATVLPTPALRLTAGLSILHDRFGQFPGIPTTTPSAGGGNAVGVGNGVGNRIVLTPDWTLNLGADYRAKLKGGSLDFNVNYYHNDGWFGESENRQRQKAYDLVNASIKWSLSQERYSIAVFGRNLTNTKYASQLTSQNFGDAYSAAAGRQYGVTLSSKF